MSSIATEFWRGKVAVVTGGTSGLGLAMARKLLECGCSVGLLARNADRLQATVSALSRDGVNVAGETGDMSDSGSSQHAIAQLIQRLGRLDVLVNNVGASSRHDLMTATAEDYLASFRNNLLPAVNGFHAAKDELLRQRGSIVNIASLAAKTAWPFMAPYSVSKSGLAAFNHQLRLELRGRLHVMLVCPGPLRRDDAGHRYSEQTAALPDAANLPGAGVRLRGIAPDRLATMIVRGLERKKAELIVPGWGRLAFALSELSPRLGDWLLRQFGAKKADG